MVTESAVGTRTTGTTGYAATACSWARTDSSPFGACSMSISSQSTPPPAQISATSGLPLHTHIPARGRLAAARPWRSVGATGVVVVFLSL